MRSLIRHFRLLLLLTGATWFAVLWHWRATAHEVDGGDILVRLVLLPLTLTLFALALGSRWAVRHARAAQAVASATALASTADTDPICDKVWPSWHVLGCWVHTPVGTGVESLLSALAAGAPRPAPDVRLRDEEGLPILSARIAGLDIAEVESALGTAATPALTRALSCLLPLIDQAAPLLHSRPAACNVAAVERPRRRVHVLATWPTGWTADDCQTARSWLTGRLQAAAVDPATAPALLVDGVRGNGVEMLMKAQVLLADLRHQDRDELMLLLACHSDLDEGLVRRMEQEHRLFGLPRRPAGLIPGEAAVALLVGTRPGTATGHAGVAAALMDGLCAEQRDRPVDAPGRTTTTALQALLTRSLDAAGLEASGVATLASDADQHTARAAELFQVLGALPHLDAATDVSLAGALCGHVGTAGPLLALAVACGQSQDSGRPALALSQSDAQWRMAAVVRPPSSPAADGPALCDFPQDGA